jgi:hypothetical protein
LTILVVVWAAPTAEAETPQERSARLFAQKIRGQADNCQKYKEQAKGNIYAVQTAFDCSCLASELNALRSEEEYRNKKISWRRCFDETTLSQRLREGSCGFGYDCECVSSRVISTLANSDIAMTAAELQAKWAGNMMMLQTLARPPCQAKK